MSEKILVSIHCLVYNHELYIRKCLDGFVMQKTNFAFEAIVHDDCSTDGSAAIIQEYADNYPEIIKPLYETENQYSKVGLSVINKILFNNSNGKYIAFCEGDDYWTDPFKLQKQVAFLEKHPECGLVYTGFKTVDESGINIKRPYFEMIKKQSKSGDMFSRQVLNNHVMTLTTCSRRELFYSELYRNSPFFFDYALSLYASLEYDLAYFLEDTGCYRKTRGSMIVSHKSDINSKLNAIRKYYIMAYLQGYGKKRSLMANMKIKCSIMRLCLSDNKLMYDVLANSPSMRLLLPMAWIIDCSNRLKKRMLM